MPHYIKLPINVSATLKPRADHIILEFETESEARDFYSIVRNTTGCPFSCDYGNDNDGFEKYSAKPWTWNSRIKVKVKSE